MPNKDHFVYTDFLPYRFQISDASRLSKVLLWISAAEIYLAGFFVAYALGPILARMNNF